MLSDIFQLQSKLTILEAFTENAAFGIEDRNNKHYFETQINLLDLSSLYERVLNISLQALLWRNLPSGSKVELTVFACNCINMVTDPHIYRLFIGVTNLCLILS